MVLPDDFRFSQSNLQDFADCKRRFYYRYIQHLSWPALESEPAIKNEQWMLNGAFFHYLVHQYYLGLPIDLISKQASGEPVKTWWRNFLNSIPTEKTGKNLSEFVLALSLMGIHLIAKYDLLALNEDGTIVIYDWKTSKKISPREYAANRLQTRLYLYILANSADKLFEGKKPDINSITLVYWYANYPDTPQIFYYSPMKMAADEQYIVDLINKIKSLKTKDEFPLTSDTQHCRYCVYRSLCDRGDVAGNLKFFDPEFNYSGELEFEFDQIEEIDF